MSQTIEMIDLVTGEIIDQQQIAEQLLAQAKEKGVSLVGPGGLTKTVLETALEAEMTDSQRSLETALDPTDEKTTRQSRR